MKTIKLNGIDIKIRRAKVKEVKNLIKDMATKFTEVANFIYNKPMTDNEFMDELPNFVMNNIEFFEKYVLKFTVDFTQDDFDNLEFLDALTLIKKIIIYNGISEGFLESFFHNFKEVSKEREKENQFVKEIPKI